MYLYLRYTVTGVVVLDSTSGRRPSLDLNITVRDLLHIPYYGLDVKNSLKNFVGGLLLSNSASEGAFERLVSI